MNGSSSIALSYPETLTSNFLRSATFNPYLKLFFFFFAQQPSVYRQNGHTFSNGVLTSKRLFSICSMAKLICDFVRRLGSPSTRTLFSVCNDSYYLFSSEDYEVLRGSVSLSDSSDCSPMLRSGVLICSSLLKSIIYYKYFSNLRRFRNKLKFDFDTFKQEYNRIFNI